jgi:hypothetical protein
MHADMAARLLPRARRARLPGAGHGDLALSHTRTAEARGERRQGAQRGTFTTGFLPASGASGVVPARGAPDPADGHGRPSWSRRESSEQ